MTRGAQNDRSLRVKFTAELVNKMETERFFSAFHQTKGGQAGGFRMTKGVQNDKGHSE